MNNDNRDDCKAADKPVVQQEPVFTSEDIPNGRDFHCDFPQGDKRLDRDSHGDVPQGDKRLDGFRLDEVMVLEIFAGTARLSRAVRDVGMSAMAIDKDYQRAKHSPIILWAHFAPSCGTAPRARGRPLAASRWARMGFLFWTK